MEKSLRECNYNSLVLNTDEDEALEREAIISAISKNVDGIILCPAQKTRNNLEFLKKSCIPYLLIGRYFQGDDSSYVVCDDFNSGYVAAKHLLELHHKKLLFINAPVYISGAYLRLEGAKKAIMDNGDLGASLETVEIDALGNAEQVCPILQKYSDCTGIICFSDMIAMQVCYFLNKLNKAVPADVSVMGFDNIASRLLSPLMLTSVSVSKTSMSVKAVDTLIKIIEGQPDVLQQHILPTKVIIRESTAKK